MLFPEFTQVVFLPSEFILCHHRDGIMWWGRQKQLFSSPCLPVGAMKGGCSAGPRRDWARVLEGCGETGQCSLGEVGGWGSKESLGSPPLGVAHSHPSPAEYVEVLQELQRLESRLQPFLQRYYEVLGSAATTDYNNNVSAARPLAPSASRVERAEIQITLSPQKMTLSATKQVLCRLGSE